jgi:hypothetical protein
MRFAVSAAALAALASLVLSGCGSSSGRVVVRSEPRPDHDKPVVVVVKPGDPGAPVEVPGKLPHGTRGPVASLGIPPGHLPPPGKCRLWFPGTPPGHQPAPRTCASLAGRVPLGAWLVHAPDAGVVEVAEYDGTKPQLVAWVAWYDADSGARVEPGSGQGGQDDGGKGNGNGRGNDDGNGKGDSGGDDGGNGNGKGNAGGNGNGKNGGNDEGGNGNDGQNGNGGSKGNNGNKGNKGKNG